MSADPWKGVDRADFPLVYVGPGTKWGLKTNTPFHVARGRNGNPVRGGSGMLTYTDPKGDVWQVPQAHVIAYEKPPSRAERVKAKVGRR